MQKDVMAPHGLAKAMPIPAIATWPVVTVALLLSLPYVAADTDVATRNRDFLLTTLPEGATVEVHVADEAGITQVQSWTAMTYATVRGQHAARMGRDYQAAAEGAPSGLGDGQEFGDIYLDLWGTTRVNLQMPLRLPSTISCCGKFEGIPQGGPGSTILGVYENANTCLAWPSGRICSFSYYWTVTQDGAEHGDSWFAGNAKVFVLPSPMGSFGEIVGTEVAENLER